MAFDRTVGRYRVAVVTVAKVRFQWTVHARIRHLFAFSIRIATLVQLRYEINIRWIVSLTWTQRRVDTIRPVRLTRTCHEMRNKVSRFSRSRVNLSGLLPVHTWILSAWRQVLDNPNEVDQHDKPFHLGSFGQQKQQFQMPWILLDKWS